MTAALNPENDIETARKYAEEVLLEGVLGNVNPSRKKLLLDRTKAIRSGNGDHLAEVKSALISIQRTRRDLLKALNPKELAL